jgi:hypothetical protein
MAARDEDPRQEVSAGRDAVVAGRDVVIHYHQPGEPAPRPRAGWNVPPRNPAFTGREALLAAVREALESGDRAVAQALQGMGGVGKTQLAIEYAHRFGGRYDIVWWLSAENADLLGEQFAALGTDLQCVPPGAPVQVVRRAVLSALRERGNWLLVFDNAERGEDIASWLPGGGGHVLITSRARGWAEIAVPVEVGVMERAESVALLRGRVPELDEAGAALVAEAAGDLPLAIAQAASYMAETGVPAGEYAALLADRAAELLAQGRPASYPRSLAAVTELAHARLRDTDLSAVMVAEICAFLAPEPVPARWFVVAAPDLPPPLTARAADLLTWHRVLAALGRSALARVDRDGIGMHRLTQAIIRQGLSGGRAAAVRQLARAVLAANFPGDPDEPGNWGEWAAVLPHLTAVDAAASDEQVLRSMIDNAAWYLTRRGDYAGAEKLARRLYAGWQDMLGADDTDTMEAEETLAEALRGMGRFAEARGLSEDIFTRRRRVHGDEHPDTLVAAHNLAIDMRRTGQARTALEMDEVTLGWRRRLLGDDHPETLTSGYSLALDRHELGDYEAARDLNADILARRRQRLGNDHPDTLRAAVSLAADLFMLKDYQTALELYGNTLTRMRRVLGDDHPYTLLCAKGHASTMDALSER